MMSTAQMKSADLVRLAFIYSVKEKTISHVYGKIDELAATMIPLTAPPLFDLVPAQLKQQALSNWIACFGLAAGECREFSVPLENSQVGVDEIHILARGFRQENAEPQGGTILFEVHTGPRQAVQPNIANMTVDQLNDFLDHASHDLQSPIRKLAVFLDRFLSATTNEDRAKYSAKMRQSLARLRELIEGFTELARAGRGNFSTEPCDAGVLVREVLEEYEEEIVGNFEVQIGQLPVLAGEKSQLRELFKNIIENAIKFRHPDRSPKIEISATYLNENERKTYGLKEGRDFSRIDIKDNGIGFDNKFSYRIFDPFIRVHATTTSIPGSGLGLAICRQIAANHNGIILADSDGRSGSTFSLFLPTYSNP